MFLISSFVAACLFLLFLIGTVRTNKNQQAYIFNTNYSTIMRYNEAFIKCCANIDVLNALLLIAIYRMTHHVV